MMRRDRIAGAHHQMDHLEGGGSGQCGCRGRGIVYHAETRYLARLAMMQRHASALPWLELANESTKRSEEHTSELQSLMRISYAVFCLNKTNNARTTHITKKQKIT